jgi:hypothetical protein
VLKLLAFVLPLGLDSFAVAAAIGASAVTTVWQAALSPPLKSCGPSCVPY